MDTFDSGCLGYVNASPVPSSVVGNVLSWDDLGPLAAGNSTTVSVWFTANAVCASALNNACVVGAVDVNQELVPEDCDDGEVCTVFAQFKDGADNESLIVSDQILLEMLDLFLPLIAKH